MEKAFELSHILYLVLLVPAMIVGLILIKKYCKTKKSVNIALAITAGTLFLIIILNRIGLAVWGDKYNSPDIRLMLPFSYCSFTSYFLPIFVFALWKNRNHAVFHFLVYTAFLGGLAATIMPAQILNMPGDKNIFGLRTLTGLLHHTLGMFLALVLIVTNEFKPDWRKTWIWFLGCCVMITFGMFQIQALGMENSMEMNKPFIDGSKFFTWYWAGPLIGGGFVMSVALFCEYFPKWIAKRRMNNAELRGNTK